MADTAKPHRAGPEERVSRSPSRKALQVECDRCGQLHIVERAGRFRDDDYLELWHEHMEALQAHRRDVLRLQRQLADALLRLEHLRAYVEFADTTLEPALAEADSFG